MKRKEAPKLSEKLKVAGNRFARRFLYTAILLGIESGVTRRGLDIMGMHRRFQKDFKGEVGIDFTLHDVWIAAPTIDGWAQQELEEAEAQGIAEPLPEHYHGMYKASRLLEEIVNPTEVVVSFLYSQIA